MEPTSNFLIKHCERAGFLGFVLFFFSLPCVNTDLSKAKLNRKEAIFLTAAQPTSLHLGREPVRWELMWCRRLTKRQNNEFIALRALCWDFCQGS